MNRRLKGFVLASLLLLASSSVYARAGSCELGCACYMATWSGGDCGTISSSGCIVIHCCC